ncbi:MAG: phage major capsid protein, partial [Phycisphaeraceae bacterium]|nr:phage major capsid protein [Phycisphaeraceae bacterium]
MQRAKNTNYHAQRQAFNNWIKTGETSNVLVTGSSGGIHMPGSVEGEVYDIAKGYGPALRIFDVIINEKHGRVGSPVIDDADNEADQQTISTQTVPVLDEDGDPVLDEDSNPVTKEVPVVDETPTVEPSLTGISLGNHPFRSGKLKASAKLVRSAGYDFADKIKNTLIQRLSRKITMQSMVGAGGANAMHGLANAAAAGVTSSSSGNFAFSDMYDLIDAVDFRVEDDEAAAFYVSRTFRRACLALKESDAKWSQSFYRVGKQWYFDGFPVHVFPALPGVATGQVPCMFGDPMAYKIRLV